MPQLQEENYTIEDIYALPEGTRAELINGQIYYMAPPSTTHQKISMFLSRNIDSYIAEKSGTCEVYASPFAVFLNETDAKYIEPDLSIICDKDKLSDKGYNGAPDWVIEIVSPASRRMDYAVKLFKYRSAGVREYWIVDKDKEKIVVYTFQPEDMQEYSFSDTVKVGIFPELSIDFAQLSFRK